MTELLDHYNAFVNFRNKFLENACANAIYTDTRETEKGTIKVRPVVVIKSESELLKLNKDIAKWKRYAELLTSKDPARFAINSSLFSIMPQVIKKPTQIAVRTGTAQSSRLMSKATFAFRLKSQLRQELAHNDGVRSKRIQSIEREIAEIEADSEQKYRIKGQSHSELYLYYMPLDGKQNKRIRVTQAGVFVFAPTEDISISYPEDAPSRKVDKERGLEAIGVKPIKTNLTLAADIYRETDRTMALQLKKDITNRVRRTKPRKEI